MRIPRAKKCCMKDKFIVIHLHSEIDLKNSKCVYVKYPGWVHLQAHYFSFFFFSFLLNYTEHSNCDRSPLKRSYQTQRNFTQDLTLFTTYNIIWPGLNDIIVLSVQFVNCRTYLTQKEKELHSEIQYWSETDARLTIFLISLLYCDREWWMSDCVGDVISSMCNYLVMSSIIAFLSINLYYISNWPSNP